MAAAAVAAIAGIPPDVHLLTGPILLGNFFGYGLYGVLVVQIFVYSHNFPKDEIGLKSIVYFVLFLDTLITALATIAAWNLLATGWGNPATLTPLNWPLTGLPCLSGLVASVVHFFFAWRIWKLRRSLLLPISICMVSLLCWAMATYSGIATRLVGLPNIGKLEPYVIVWLGGSTFVDVVITIAMVFILLTAKRSTVFQESSSKLSRLITITVETGMATAFGAMSELILFVVFPKNNLHFIPFLMLAKLYSNTLLATLNSRAPFRKNDVIKPSLWNDTLTVRQSSSTSTTRGHGSADIPLHQKSGVQISTVVEIQPSDIEMYGMSSNKEDRPLSLIPQAI